MQIKTKGIILKELASGDEDKLLTILTEDRGVIFAYARGARRFKNRLAPSTGLLCYSSMVLFWNRDRYSLDYADSIEQFFELRQSVEKLALASYFAEVSAMLGPKENDKGQFLKLLLNCLSFLQSGRMDGMLLKAVSGIEGTKHFRFYAGFGCPARDVVAIRRHRCFYPNEGTLYCADCSVDRKEIHIFLTAGALAAMRHIIYSPMEKLFAFTIGAESICCLNDAAEQFLQSQTERNYQSLEFFHSLLR